MLNFPRDSRKNSVENIVFRNTYITGEVKEVEDEATGKYKIEIAGSGKDYPGIYAITVAESLSVGQKVCVFWERGNREKPIVAGKLRDIETEEEIEEVDAIGEPEEVMVITKNAHTITETTAYLKGEIDLIGAAGNCTRRGFQYGETTEYGSDVHADGSFGEGEYSLQVSKE